jgi:hypothetical protein
MWLATIDDFAVDGGYNKYYKLHGSTNWWRRGQFKANRDPGMFPDSRGSSDSQRQQDAIEYAADIDLLGHYSVGRSSDGLWLPAIAIPMSGAKAFECPDQHVNDLRRSVPLIRRVLVIGWRAGDQHLLDLLAKQQQQPWHFNIVAGSAHLGISVANALRAAGVRAVQDNYHPFEGGFSHYVSSRAARAFLQRTN